MTEHVLDVRGVTKQFEDEQALRDFNLSLRDQEILTLIGPSGCGKTTALRIIAGLEKPDEGTVLIEDRTVTGSGVFEPPEDRNVGFVFQDLALFPHLSVSENVAFGLSGNGTEKEERLNRMLDFVGLSEYRERHPDELSGGQKQRVALARSLITRPSILLLDEPFSNIDKELRERLRHEVRDILKELDIPTLFVTHHQEEAIFLGDRTAVMSEGHVVQVDQPEELVLNPSSRFVAEFLGPTEFLSARKTPRGIETEIQTLPPEMVDAPETDPFDLMIRADDVRIEVTENEEADGVVEDGEFLGGLFRYKIRLNSGQCVYSLRNHAEQIRPDTRVRVHLDPGHQLVGFEPKS